METKNDDVADLQSRLGRLCDKSSQAAASCEKKRKIFLAVGIVVVLLCVLCLGRLSGLAVQLDARTLTEIGRQQVERYLPSGRENIQEHLKREAPAFVKEVFRACINFLPSIRERFINDMMERLEIVAARHEVEFCEQMRMSIAAAREKLDKEVPGQSETDKMKLLVTAVCQEFEGSFRSLLEAMYPRYQEEMERVQHHLLLLSTTDSDKLTERERTEKEIIETFLRLVILEKTKGKKT